MPIPALQTAGLSILLLSTTLLTATPSLAATSYVDLTGKEYSGPDSDLSGFSLTKFGVNCEENGSYVAGQDSFISWENHSARTEPSKATIGVAQYTIHFRVKDRKGAIIHEEDFSYNGHTSTWPHTGRVIWGDPNYGCDRSAVRFSSKIDLSYATVEYWATKINWQKELPQPTKLQQGSDNIAFSVDVHSPKPESIPLSSEDEKTVKGLEPGCKGGNGNSCFSLGYLYAGKGAFQKAMPYYETACGKKIPDGCTNFGFAIEQVKSSQSPSHYYKLGCDLGSEDGCVDLGLLELKSGKKASAISWFKLACIGKKTLGCIQLGVLADNQGDGKSAVTYWMKACDSKLGMGCALLGEFHQNHGDVQKSRDFYRKGCDYGEQNSCSALGQ